MNILEATENYEVWLGDQMSLLHDDLVFKHQQMALSEFGFFRATFYRWAQKWAKTCGKASHAPEVLAVGDLHVENFGTWRDIEGRLVWGVNDFDEAIPLPYTNDLIRLAASAALAIKEQRLNFDLQEACEAILEGYSKSLERHGRPFVLEERHAELRKMATSSLRNPDQFWAKMTGLPAAGGPEFAEALTTIGGVLPVGCESESARSRRAGLGSLGRPRYVVLAEVDGALIAREAKRMAGSAVCWAGNQKGPYTILYEKILEGAVRCRDPHVKLDGNWLVRRLAPHCTRITIEDWPNERDEIDLIRAMGFETANVHQSEKKATAKVADDLGGRSEKWLRKSTEAMLEVVEEDWTGWREHLRSQ